MSKYELHTSISDEIADGWVWVRETDRQNELQGRRPVARLSRVGDDGSRRCVYCETVYADARDMGRFGKRLSLSVRHDRVVFISKWYRDRLGITEPIGSEIDLTISIPKWWNSFAWKCRACFQHPQVVVRLATWLGILGLTLGVLGVVLAVLPLLSGPAKTAPSAVPETYVPGLGEMMSLQQMRHVKLWFAGQAENWELAAYEIDELGEGFDDIVKFHPTHKDSQVAPKDAIPRMMTEPLKELRAAIDKKDARAFVPAYDALTAACNNCHQATNFTFNTVQTPTSNPYPNQVFTRKK